MTKPSKSGSGTRLGVRLRGRLTSVYNRRGKTKADIVLHYSSKCRADVALAAELQVLHFLHAESDPDVESVLYEMSATVTQLAGAIHAELVHAEVVMKDGTRVWRRLVQELPDNVELAQQLSAMAGTGSLATIARVETWTRDRLVANPMRLRNALRASAWIAAARHWPLVEHKKQVLALVRKRPTTFEGALALGEGPQQALFGAAALELAFSGSIRHDLFEQPLTAISNFYENGV